MALANIVRAAVIPPSNWNQNIFNGNMIEGDRMYLHVQLLSNVPPYSYLNVQNFHSVKQDFLMFNKRFSIDIPDGDSPIFGSLQDNRNNEIGVTLLEGLEELFSSHNAGILISGAKSFSIMHYCNKYYFTDSHSCGPKGASAANGKACIIESDNVLELKRICKRATSSRNIQFTIDYIDVHVQELSDDNETLQQPVHINLHQEPDISIHQQDRVLQEEDSVTMGLQTYVMTPIDCVQPDVEEILEVSQDLNKIIRKTTDNIVNESHELKAEELAWFYLFPYGINGIKEERSTPITPLDYYQFRIMGRDKRFQGNDYLFYALSMFEYYRVKSSIAACVKKIENKEGKVEDVHLYIKNLRGSAAYWRSAMHELIAQIRCLGPPQFFITFSCNDLHWEDMKKALLLADGQTEIDPVDLDIYATQKLIEKYPLVVSQHFMLRVSALMKVMKSNDCIFSGKLKDFWWRIEFQNRGSPHLHMVVWIHDYPQFDTPEGIEKIDEVCSCSIPGDNINLSNLVQKCQLHRHTSTCTKNSSTHCRFAFPRESNSNTRIVAHTSEEFLRSGGRICILKRKPEEKWVNNYNPILLSFWEGNMDIQPCGNNEAIAFYVAKYLAKSEPSEMSRGISDAIKHIRKEESEYLPT